MSSLVLSSLFFNNCSTYYHHEKVSMTKHCCNRDKKRDDDRMHASLPMGWFIFFLVNSLDQNQLAQLLLMSLTLFDTQGLCLS